MGKEILSSYLTNLDSIVKYFLFNKYTKRLQELFCSYWFQPYCELFFK